MGSTDSATEQDYSLSNLTFLMAQIPNIGTWRVVGQEVPATPFALVRRAERPKKIRLEYWL
jgi:hypothetical protein